MDFCFYRSLAAAAAALCFASHAAAAAPQQEYESIFRSVAESARRGTPPPPPPGVVDLAWRNLSPPGYNPARTLLRLEVGKLDEHQAHPAVMAQIRREWDLAPTVEPPAGKYVRMAAFAVPLDDGKGPVHTAILSPFDGFDIQAPMPPANQLMLVRFDRALSRKETRYPIWVTGKVSLQPVVTRLARVAYRMSDAKWEAYPYQKYELPPYQWPR